MSVEATPMESEKIIPTPQRHGLKKGLYVLPSAFTAANIGMGYYAVMSALRGFQFLHEGSTAVEVERAVEF